MAGSRSKHSLSISRATAGAIRIGKNIRPTAGRPAPARVPPWDFFLLIVKEARGFLPAFSRRAPASSRSRPATGRSVLFPVVQQSVFSSATFKKPAIPRPRLVANVEQHEQGTNEYPEQFNPETKEMTDAPTHQMFVNKLRIGRAICPEKFHFFFNLSATSRAMDSS